MSRFNFALSRVSKEILKIEGCVTKRGEKEMLTDQIGVVSWLHEVCVSVYSSLQS